MLFAVEESISYINHSEPEFVFSAAAKAETEAELPAQLRSQSEEIGNEHLMVEILTGRLLLAHNAATDIASLTERFFCIFFLTRKNDICITFVQVF